MNCERHLKCSHRLNAIEFNKRIARLYCGAHHYGSKLRTTQCEYPTDLRRSLDVSACPEATADYWPPSYSYTRVAGL